MAVVTFYKIPVVITLTKGGTGARLMNYPVNRTDFVAFRNVKNEIDFFIKDADRKPVNILGATLTANIINRQTGQLVLTKNLIVVDDTISLMQLILTPADTMNWETGYYDYSILINTGNGQPTLLYTDRNRRAEAYFELVEGPVPAPVPATIIPASVFTPESTGNPTVNYFVAGSYPGAATIGNTSGVHTITTYTTNFVGLFKIQATLDNQPSSDDSFWFDVDISQTLVNGTSQTSGSTAPYFGYVNQTGVQAFTITGNYTYVRFVYYVGNANTIGTFDQVLFKA